MRARAHACVCVCLEDVRKGRGEGCSTEALGVLGMQACICARREPEESPPGERRGRMFTRTARAVQLKPFGRRKLLEEQLPDGTVHQIRQILGVEKSQSVSKPIMRQSREGSKQERTPFSFRHFGCSLRVVGSVRMHVHVDNAHAHTHTHTDGSRYRQRLGAGTRDAGRRQKRKKRRGQGHPRPRGMGI